MKRKILDHIRSLQFLVSVTTAVIVAAVVVAASYLQYSRFSETLISNRTTNSAQVVDQVANTLDTYTTNLLAISDKLIANLSLQASADKAGTESYRSFLSNTCEMNESIACIMIFDKSGNLLEVAPRRQTRDMASVISQEWYLHAAESELPYTFSPPHIQNIFAGEYFWTVTLSRKLRDESGSFPVGSLFALDMNFSQMEQYCADVTIGKRGYVFIVDEENNIIYHPQQQVVNAGLKSEDLAFIAGKDDGEFLHSADDSIVVIRSLDNTGWRLVGISYLSETSEVKREIMTYLIIFLAAAIPAIFGLSLGVSKLVLRPLARLTESMKKVRDGDFNIRTETQSTYEVEQLSNTFNHMVDRINELMGQVIHEQEELRKTELKALQAQINPHFLYNTLGSILWMCEQNKGPEAAVMVTALSNLFRISISKGKELIPIRDELKHAESYLIIQKVRYKDQFTYTIDADESLLDCLCPKICLQPLIENAIYHGIDRCVDDGKISIRIAEEEGGILMQVSDNGLGMSEEMMAGILQSESGHDYGIGLKNVNSRIQIFFGKQYGIKISSRLDEGTCVDIHIPKTKGETGE